MVNVNYKTINGKKYLYAEYSFRLPNGNIKKISKLLKKGDKENSKKIKDYFLKKQIESYQDYALKTFRTDSILTDEQIKKLESMRVEYQKIIKSFTKNQVNHPTASFCLRANPPTGGVGHLTTA
ncbi:MAG TPA: hypothetical protein VJK51_04780 [Candidatus Nanoarchaeia archaeon]|nr:hypothetical protein [Candidatus Nanoarchaeia archaeon]